MSNESLIFSLEPVGSAASQAPATTYSDTAIGAEYQVIEQGFLNANDISGYNSPACFGGNCIVMHEAGPGVTTLSIGEEEGTGDYLARAVLDGVAFLEPPVSTFTSGGDFQFATLAIGEDAGAVVSAPPAIGQAGVLETQPVQSYAERVALDAQPVQTYYERVTIETQPIVSYADPVQIFAAPAPAPVYAEPIPSDDWRDAALDFGRSTQTYAPFDAIASGRYEATTMQPIYTAPEVPPAATVSAYEFSETAAVEPLQPAPFEPVSTLSEPLRTVPLEIFMTDPVPMPAAPVPMAPTAGLEPIQTVPFVEPREKPGLISMPAPIAKSAVLPEGDGRVTVEYLAPRAKPEIYINGSPVPYLRPEPGMTASGITGIAPEQALSGEFISVGSYDDYLNATGGGAAAGGTVLEPLATDPVMELPVPAAEPLIIDMPDSSSVVEPGTSEEIALTPQVPESAVITGTVASDEAGQAPMTPASISMAEPASGQASGGADALGGSEAEVMTSSPDEMRLGTAAPASDAPLLTEEDFRITTLALGEEDGG